MQPAQSKELPFKEQYSLEERKELFQKISANDSEGFIYAVIEKDAKCTKYCSVVKKLTKIDKNQNRIAVQRDLKNKLSKVNGQNLQNQAMFLFITSKLLTTNEPFSAIYQKHKDPQDGFLYLKYSNIDTF